MAAASASKPSRKYRRGIVGLILLAAGAAQAADVNLVGLFPGKAVLVVNNAAPKIYAAGAAIGDGVRLVSVGDSSAVIEVNGKRQTIALGEHVHRSSPSARQSVTLKSDGRGHFIAQGQINGSSARMLVDTGATVIAIPAVDAVRFGIDYTRGQPAAMNTANGVAPGYRVKLDTVRVGDITINQVDAVVMEQGLSTILLGMSFLNRTEMRRDGEEMTLTRRF